MKRSSTHSLLRLSLLPVLLLVAPTVACVTSGTHDAVTAERDGLKSENARLDRRVRQLEMSKGSLESERLNLIDGMEDLREKRGELERDLKRLRRAEAELSESLAKREAELAVTSQELSKLTGTYDGLVEDLEEEVASGQIEIEQLREGLRLNLSQSILFPSGSASLNRQGQVVLTTVAARLKELPNDIEVQGHTDNVALNGPRTNWELAAERSAQVVRLFANSGIDPRRLKVVSFGENAPIAANDTPEGRAKNRRIEIRLAPSSTSSRPEVGDTEAEVGDAAAEATSGEAESAGDS
jgi:chemotaxis protein MotB